ncbi:hypothetical protein C4J81_08815 [Deltaproteobacteria bacterium Smac51]|nr:hypothetical protein C4J81_08815 [Deltaproteobacteria bacterium Smac51]
MATKSDLSTLMRTLGRQLRSKLADSLGYDIPIPPRPSPRMSVVEKVSRNALFELVGRAKSHPQRGEMDSANPAYVALAELTEESGRPGLALGLRYETGEITFLDLDLETDKVEKSGGAYVERSLNLRLWRRLEELIYIKVDSTMVGPRKPIRPPEEVDI